ncbi:MAG: helix-turn-helix domain-containing protein [Gemmatimonadaceae bacterium]
MNASGPAGVDVIRRMLAIRVLSREQHCLLTMSEDPVPDLKRQLPRQLVARLEGWSQTDAAALIGTDQPRISDLRRGRLDRISLEQLIRLLGRVGGSIELGVSWSSQHSYLYARGNSDNEQSK